MVTHSDIHTPLATTPVLHVLAISGSTRVGSGRDASVRPSSRLSVARGSSEARHACRRAKAGQIPCCKAGLAARHKQNCHFLRKQHSHRPPKHARFGLGVSAPAGAGLGIGRRTVKTGPQKVPKLTSSCVSEERGGTENTENTALLTQKTPASRPAKPSTPVRFRSSPLLSEVAANRALLERPPRTRGRETPKASLKPHATIGIVAQSGATAPSRCHAGRRPSRRPGNAFVGS
jgi:hypothetical protein